jgi:ABC-2 type transport system ATP-binding protein
MDEAERCHKLANIAYGKLMAEGTAEEIIAEQKLTTWEVSGDDLHAVTEKLRGLPGIDQIATFGTNLHVTGRDAATLEASIHKALGGTSCEAHPTETGLEDVFINLMQKSVDNFEAKKA